MIERSKDEQEKMGRYQTMIMSAVIAAVIVFIAPTLIVILTDTPNPDNLSADKLLFQPPKKMVNGTASDENLLPSGISDGIQNIFELLLWFVRIVLIIMIIVGVIMLRVDTSKAGPASSAAVQRKD